MWLDVFGFVRCCICTPECDAHVSVFEEIGKFSYSWAIVRKDCPFFYSLSSFWRIFCCTCTFSFVMILSGDLLLSAVYFIVFHSVCCLSFVNGKDCILVI